MATTLNNRKNNLGGSRSAGDGDVIYIGGGWGRVIIQFLYNKPISPKENPLTPLTPLPSSSPSHPCHIYMLQFFKKRGGRGTTTTLLWVGCLIPHYFYSL